MKPSTSDCNLIRWVFQIRFGLTVESYLYIFKLRQNNAGDVIKITMNTHVVWCFNGL